jgi:hypothetical protein
MSDKKTIKVRRVKEGDLVTMLDGIIAEKVEAAKAEWISEQKASESKTLSEDISKLVEAKVAAILESTKK